MQEYSLWLDNKILGDTCPLPWWLERGASVTFLGHLSLQTSSWALVPLVKSLQLQMAAPETEAAVPGSALPQTAAPCAEEPQPDRQVLPGSSICRGRGTELESG